MPGKPIVFKTSHTVRFSELDPYNHMGTGVYATLFVDHRMEGLRTHLGWSLTRLETLPFMVWVRRMEIDFVRPVQGDQQVIITSYVDQFDGPNAAIVCDMKSEDDSTLSRCLMTVAFVEKSTQRSADWPQDVMDLFYEPVSNI